MQLFLDRITNAKTLNAKILFNGAICNTLQSYHVATTLFLTQYKNICLIPEFKICRLGSITAFLSHWILNSILLIRAYPS